jgi:hypothetical protein
VVAGSSLREGVKSLVLDRRMLSADARIFVRIDDPEIMRVWLRVAREGSAEAGENLPWRTQQDGSKKLRAVALTFLDPARASVDLGAPGEMIIDAKPGTSVYLRGDCERRQSVKVSAGTMNGHEVVFFDGGEADSVELPLPLRGREYVPVAIGIVHGGKRYGTLRATQRTADGELSPGYEIRS